MRGRSRIRAGPHRPEVHVPPHGRGPPGANANASGLAGARCGGEPGPVSDRFSVAIDPSPLLSPLPACSFDRGMGG